MKSVSGFKTGERIVVRNGARGEQVAVVASVTRNDTLRAHKWLSRGQRWTGLVTIYPAEVLRFAGPSDFKKRRVKAMAPVATR